MSNKMATPKTGKPEGRPPIRFDLEGITTLSALNCTKREVAAFFGVSESTVEHRFTSEPDLKAAWEKGCATGKLSLRRKQTELANAGNVTMLIWLGKQLLGQRDKTELSGEIEHHIKRLEGIPLEEL
jgi:hypothetical protein